MQEFSTIVGGSLTIPSGWMSISVLCRSASTASATLTFANQTSKTIIIAAGETQSLNADTQGGDTLTLSVGAGAGNVIVWY